MNLVDFVIRHGVGEGERMSLAPGDAGPEQSRFVNVDVVAFFAVESFVRPELPDGAYDHYGVTRVDAASARRAMAAMMPALAELRASTVTERKALDYVTNAPWISIHAELLESLRLGGLASIQQLSAMLEELQDLVSGWLDSYPTIFIYGV